MGRSIAPNCKFVTAPALAERFGFSARHWTRLAAEGKIPGARQPFGAHGRWVFDIDAVSRWWDAQRVQVHQWPTSTKGAPSGGGARKKTAKSFDAPLRRDLKASRAIALGFGSKR